MIPPMPEIICQFCQKLVKYSPIERMESVGIEVYWCETCHAEYLRRVSEETIRSCSLYTIIDGRTYRWSVNHVGYASLWHVVNPGIPGQTMNGKNVWLYGTREHKSITPQTVNEKIRTYLLFL